MHTSLDQHLQLILIFNLNTCENNNGSCVRELNSAVVPMETGWFEHKGPHIGDEELLRLVLLNITEL